MLKVAELLFRSFIHTKKDRSTKGGARAVKCSSKSLWNTMVSNTAILFKNLFIIKKPLLREIILPGVPVMLEIVAL